MSFKLEVIGFNIESCKLAQKAGAHRVELCDNPADGGTTPSYGFIKEARDQLQIDLFPIIRPRGGDFLYSDEEYKIMKWDVVMCKKLGCDGIVIGILNTDGTVDKKRTAHLVELAYPMSVTFHRAFDRTNEPFKAMNEIIDIGCERILTSGQKTNAQDGTDLITQLIREANERIIIMPGSGIRSDNILDLATKTGAREFHSSARMNLKSMMNFTNEQMNENLTSTTLDTAEVKKMIASLNN